MTESKHTPGPWIVVPTLAGALSINKTPQVPIATVGGAGWHLGEDAAGANARLIAAAPDLLAALRGGDNLHWVHNAAISTNIESLRAICMEWSRWWNSEALPAIAKAEGRS